MIYNDINFNLLLSKSALLIFFIVIIVVTLCGFYKKNSGAFLRLFVFLVLFLIASNPTGIKKEKTPVKDIVLVLSDYTNSQIITNKIEETKEALENIALKITNLKNIDLRKITITNENEFEDNLGTSVFNTLNNTINNLPAEQLSAIVIISDGQINDLDQYKKLNFDGPIHFLLTGKKNELDRSLLLKNVPQYALVGEEINFQVKVDDLASKKQVKIKVTLDNEKLFTKNINVNEFIPISFKVPHAGENTIEVSVEKGSSELTLENNSKIIKINGIFDRLRVMLISGEPNMGLRSWRNILNSDPSIELIHFTILRPPNKRDLTPVRQLSLIPFPTKELFSASIDEFDLVIFDQYSLNGVLPKEYLENIVNYVYKGGAVLDASGPSYASKNSLSNSPLKEILPTKPTGEVINKEFFPTLSTLGVRHPVTSKLYLQKDNKRWGKWYSYIDTIKISGDTLLETDEGKPLLILNKLEKGRVAQLLSDSSWVWSRSIDNKGPQSKLLRRTIHWLLKEPELQENNIITKVKNGKIEIFKNTLIKGDVSAKVVKPDGKIQNIVIKDNMNGQLSAVINANISGKYKIIIGEKIKTLFVGNTNYEETNDVRSSDKLVSRIALESNGGVFWLNQGIPDIIRITNKSIIKAGVNWIGITSKNNFVNKKVSNYNVIPWYLLFFVLIFLIFFAWYRESKN